MIDVFKGLYDFLVDSVLSIPMLFDEIPVGFQPATPAGNITLGNAEWLNGLVMIQLYKPGASVIYGGVFANIDYSTCVMTYGSPELQLQTFATAQMAHHYGIPSFGTAGCTACFNFIVMLYLENTTY